jgi:signal transduction histidine kinase
MGSRRPIRPAWSQVLAIAAALVALAVALAFTRNRLQGELHALLAEREGQAVAALFEGRMAALRAEGNDDPFLAAVEVAAMPRMEGIRRMTLMDAEGRFPSRLLGDGAVDPPGIEDLKRFQGRVLTTFLPAVSNGIPRLRIHAPVRDESGAGVVALLAVEMDGTGLEAEYRLMDVSIRKQGWLTLMLAGGAMVVALGFAFARLSRANALLAERTERLQKANRELTLAARTGAVGAVASHLVHGLRNPLAGLQSFVASLSDSGPDSATLADATATARRMKSMIDEVVGVLRDEDGVHAYEVSVTELLPLVARRLPASAARRGVRLEFQCSSGRLLANREANLLLLILENLMSNAAEGSPDGRPVQVSAAEARDGSLEVRVADEGTGLSEAVRKGLFQPLNSSKPDGSGLGLAITRRLALAIDAELELESTGPTGTVFRVRLPAVPGSSKESAVAPGVGLR